MIIDLVLLALLAGVAVRGWTRGFLREAVDVAGLALGVVFAFRAAPLLGAVVAAMSGMSEDAARLTAGIIVFGGAVVAIVLTGRALDRRMADAVAGPADRAGGAGLASLWGVFLMTVVLSLATLSPLPAAVDESLDRSSVARALVDPQGVPQAVFSRLAGDRIVASLISLQRLFGERRVVIGPDETIAIPPADAEALDRDQAAAADVFDRLNRARIDDGLAPLAWSDALSEVAAGHAFDMYTNGYFAHTSPSTGGLADRLRMASIPYRVAGENLALAASPGDVHRGLMDSPGHRANILGADYRRVGVAVVAGPLGLMTVQVFTG